MLAYWRNCCTTEFVGLAAEPVDVGWLREDAGEEVDENVGEKTPEGNETDIANSGNTSSAEQSACHAPKLQKMRFFNDCGCTEHGNNCRRSESPEKTAGKIRSQLLAEVTVTRQPSVTNTA
jgi:hypothetical protein